MAIYMNDSKYDMLAVNVEAEEPSLGEKTVTGNGTYNASDDSLDGYSKVIVDVSIPEPDLKEKTVTENGTYNAFDENVDGFSKVVVDVELPPPTLIEKNVDSNGVYSASDDSADGYSKVRVSIPDPVLQTRSVTPSETAQQIRAQAEYDALEEVDVAAIPTTYVGSGVARRSSSDLSASGATVNVPAGYYPNQASKAVSGVTQATPSITVSSGGLITASADQSAGYVSSGTKSATKQLTTQAAKTVTPSASEQTAVNSGVFTTGVVKVAAVPTETKTITQNGTYTPSSGKFFSSILVDVASGGNPNIATGTLNVSSDVKTATSTKITDVASLGFTPKAFILMRETALATRYHIQYTAFVQVGTTYYRPVTYRGSSSYTNTVNTSSWTTQTAGYLYFNSNNIYVRTSTSYYLGSGTWHWVAMTW